MSKPSLILCSVLALALVTSGCGHKGPLVPAPAKKAVNTNVTTTK